MTLQQKIDSALAKQWARRIQPAVSIDLPFPPSMNALWKKGRTGMYRSPRYMSWIRDAGCQLELQKPGCIAGNYVIAVQLERKDNRRRDADNFLKAVSDLLVMHGVLTDDALAEAVMAMWSPTVKGCRVVVTAVNPLAKKRAA